MKKWIGFLVLLLVVVATAHAVTTKTGSYEWLDFQNFTKGLVSGNSSDSKSIMTDTVTIPYAEVIALRATPKTIVAPPVDTDHVLEFLDALIILNAGTDVLTESTDNLVIQYTDGTDASAAIESTNFLDQSVDMFAKAVGTAVAGGSDIDGLGLELFNTGSSEFGGGSGVEITVKSSYRVHKLGL